MVNLEQCRKIILQAIALIGVNMLAFVYDGQYIPLALGVDAVVLGVTVNGVAQKKTTEATATPQ